MCSPYSHSSSPDVEETATLRMVRPHGNEGDWAFEQEGVRYVVDEWDVRRTSGTRSTFSISLPWKPYQCLRCGGGIGEENMTSFGQPIPSDKPEKQGFHVRYMAMSTERKLDWNNSGVMMAATWAHVMSCSVAIVFTSLSFPFILNSHWTPQEFGDLNNNVWTYDKKSSTMEERQLRGTVRPDGFRMSRKRTFNPQ